MKTISQKDLKRLVKEKGWELTPDSKETIYKQNIASLLSKQVEAIVDLAKSVDDAKEALRAETEKDYTFILNRLIRSIEEIKIETAPAIMEQKDYKFIVKRDQDGFITEIEATKI
ncbi:MAG: hypothetical protein B5M48_03815 [Candidatus Omnitrophica bacterium 4484_213]|nr:MAG: hypothetical protein B5M48_03815 [Candidatus Omnitrophica bacterium 4484_213]